MDRTLRPELEPLPGRMVALPVAKGYPVPWFVGWLDGEPEFRGFDPKKMARAISEKRCWVCGELLGKYMTFVTGPMCIVNRTSAEPPSHKECARWSARNCPFLSKPTTHRREAGAESFKDNYAGMMLLHNPGVICLWTVTSYGLYADPDRGGVLFRVPDPDNYEWLTMGRPASREEVLAAVDKGLPTLLAAAAEDGPGCVAEMDRLVKKFQKYLPRE